MQDSLEGIKVLLIDDDALTLEVFEFTLTEAGAEVKPCSSAEEALDQIQVWRPDVIVSDIGLPDADGFMLIREVRHHKETQNILALAVTGYSSREDRGKIISAGYNSVLGKPVDPFQLIQSIRDLLTRAH